MNRKTQGLFGDACLYSIKVLRNLDRELKNGWDSQAERAPWHVTVNVAQVVPDEDLDCDDLEDNPAGAYEYTVEARNEEEAGELALDRFHDEIPIAVLDHFHIEAKGELLIDRGMKDSAPSR